MIRMRKSVLLALSAAVVISVAAAALESSDDSSALICDNVRVYILNEDGSYTMSAVGDVQTVKAAVTKAMDDQGRTMKLNTTQTAILSVDGRGQDDGRYWRVFQWLPAGTSGWGVQAFNTSSDGKMVSGTSYCITLSSMSVVNGTTVYSVPDFEPKSVGYVFIRFANGYSPDNEHVKSVFTSEIREQGFWLRGEGSNMGAVLTNAIESNWPGEIDTFTGDAGGGTDVSSWINTLFGLGNDSLGDSVWAYWSQWTWVDHKWSYNSWTLGYYDPAVYPYMECIYLISTPDPYSGDYIIDKGGAEPNPDTDEIVCMKNILTVDFRLEDGTLWKSQKVNYGQQVDMSQIPEPSAPGKGFVEWGGHYADSYGRSHLYCIVHRCQGRDEVHFLQHRVGASDPQGIRQFRFRGIVQRGAGEDQHQAVRLHFLRLEFGSVFGDGGHLRDARVHSENPFLRGHIL